MTDQANEPMFDVAHLAMSQLFTPKLDASLAFFTDIIGMDIVERSGDSVFLRAYEDPYRYSLQLTAGPTSGPGVTTFRTTSATALERRATALEASGLGRGWAEPAFGHGRAYLFETPGGHAMRLVYDVERPVITDDNRTHWLNRPTRRPDRGVPVRRLDHINYLAPDVPACQSAMEELLGFRLTERVVDADDVTRAAWLRVTNLTHDVAFLVDPSGERGRLHHLAFWYSSPQHLLDVCDLCADRGIAIDAGPGKHGPSQAHYLYVWEPGGNRIELFGDVGFLVFDPTWEPVTWRPDSPMRQGYGAKLVPEFFLLGSPPAPRSNG
jgi:catechol 2,3-dioxygenase